MQFIPEGHSYLLLSHANMFASKELLWYSDKFYSDLWVVMQIFGPSSSNSSLEVSGCFLHTRSRKVAEEVTFDLVVCILQLCNIHRLVCSILILKRTLETITMMCLLSSTASASANDGQSLRIRSLPNIICNYSHAQRV